MIRPNQALERIADWRESLQSMTSTVDPFSARSREQSLGLVSLGYENAH